MEIKKKVLVIGCGNIGALYDLGKEGVRTHVKAFSQNSHFDTAVFDHDERLKQKVAAHYQIEALDDLHNAAAFDVIVISTPTATHFDFLSEFFTRNVPVIVCEKPITDTVAHLEALEGLRQRSQSKVLVNYFRRFQPSYHLLKKLIHEKNERPVSIQVNYQRGFSNNASHALDLMYYFFGETELTNIKVQHFAFDEFDNDPTVTLTADFGGIPVVFNGLAQAKYSFFEVKLFFRSSLISLERNGSDIRLFSAREDKQSGYYLPLEPLPSAFDGLNATDKAMQHVAGAVLGLLQNPSAQDNFESSIKINYQTLKIISPYVAAGH